MSMRIGEVIDRSELAWKRSHVKPDLRCFLPVKGQKCKASEKPVFLRSISLREFDKGQKFWIHDTRSVREVRDK